MANQNDRRIGLSWLFKMAWRDSRRNTGRLVLFMSSIVLGIGALVAINSFGDNLNDQIEGEAKELLGADLEVKSRTPIGDEVRERFDSLGFAMSEEMAFSSMVYFPKNAGTRLVYVRAVEDGFPYYGDFETAPQANSKEFTTGQNALVDQTLLLQFDAAPGDSVKIGELTFNVAASVLKVPGQSAITTTVAPPVFIPLRLMDKTGLNQLGSRMEYKIYAKYPDDFDPKVFEEFIAPWLEDTEYRFDDVAERKEEVGDTYADLTGFLALTAFIALILGCLGVAGSVHIYLKEKVASVAVLRCLGASGKQAMGIFLIQVVGMGFIGSSIGALLGASFQAFLPGLFADFVPFDVEMQMSWLAIAQGVAIGVVASLLFALLSLLRLQKISPLKAIRASFETTEPDRYRVIVGSLILIFVYGFAWFQLSDAWRALVFTIGIVGSFAILAGVAQAIIYFVRRFFPTGSSFVLRQGLANLYRPNNQTLILVVTIGLGTALISTLFISQNLLIDKVQVSSSGDDRPNMVLFDIQTDQIAQLNELAKTYEMPVLNQVPIVTMRLHSLKGRGVEELRADTTLDVRHWVLNREYRVSYRDSMTDSETLLEGKWQRKVDNPGDSIFISLDERLIDDMKVELGDEIAFNVQGAIIKTYVGSFREIDWQRMQTNFLVMFPEGVLEKAPKFHVLLTRFESGEQSATFQQKVVENFPNISVIDLQLVLATVDAVLAKVSFVIRFMAFFSIFTGILVLIGSLLISKYQRVRESVLLRTLGAQKHHILKINTLEYFLLGSLASLSGIIIALIAGALLAWFSFDTTMSPDFPILGLVYVSITALTVLIGLSNSSSVLGKPPLEVLRS
ncbi:MAG: ABC transporter permease [Cryomorphaceae bacterium]